MLCCFKPLAEALWNKLQEITMGGKVTSARITVYLPPEKAEELGEWATSEHRSVSNLVAAVLLNALEDRKARQEKEQQDKGAA
jgi:CopG-like RHH_1 or ribbon-helix-helix domain, RHH_5